MKIFFLFALFFGSLSSIAQADTCLVYVPHVIGWDCDMSTEDGFHAFANCEMDNYKETIFNRWGEIIHETNDPDFYWKPWGQDFCDGVFVWVIEFTAKGDADFDGVFEDVKVKHHGHVMCPN
ncbi:MAG: hypothetical protein ACI857_001133 [Arenicella sp.]|jgi:hypothetical protein